MNKLISLLLFFTSVFAYGMEYLPRDLGKIENIPDAYYTKQEQSGTGLTTCIRVETVNIETLKYDYFVTLTSKPPANRRPIEIWGSGFSHHLEAFQITPHVAACSKSTLVKRSFK